MQNLHYRHFYQSILKEQLRGQIKICDYNRNPWKSTRPFKSLLSIYGHLSMPKAVYTSKDIERQTISTTAWIQSGSQLKQEILKQELESFHKDYGVKRETLETKLLGTQIHTTLGF